MRIIGAILFFGFLACLSCDSRFKKTSSGLNFEVLKKGDGVRPLPGNHVVFDMMFKDSKDSVWGNTFIEENPSYSVIKDSAFLKKETGVEQVFRMISKGDSIKYTVSADEIFVKTWRLSLPDGVRPTDNFTFYIRVADILNKSDFLVWQADVMFKREQRLDEQMRLQLNKDKDIIDRHLDSLGVEVQKTESGLRYMIVKEGKGDRIKSMQTVSVNYIVYLLDGTCFDTNIEKVAREKGVFGVRKEPYEPYLVPVDNSKMIIGWHEMLKLMNKGSKATVYVPSTMAYGDNKMNRFIKENTILVFDLEVIDVK